MKIFKKPDYEKHDPESFAFFAKKPTHYILIDFVFAVTVVNFITALIFALKSIQSYFVLNAVFAVCFLCAGFLGISAIDALNY